MEEGVWRRRVVSKIEKRRGRRVKRGREGKVRRIREGGELTKEERARDFSLFEATVNYKPKIRVFVLHNHYLLSSFIKRSPDMINQV